MTLKDEVTQTKAGVLAWNEEYAALATTELICGLMHDHGISIDELAQRLRATTAYLEMLLDGEIELTIPMVSAILSHLGYQFTPGVVPLSEELLERMNQ